MDGRIPRLWYLPTGWKGVSAPRSVKDYLTNSTLLRKATSWPGDCDWERVKKSPYIFLSRSPLTFGHSQLVVPSPNNCDEQDLFQLASRIICNVISTFRDAFIKRMLHEEKAFSSLKENTLTYGLYKKTLLLRTSADEDSQREYKVHLVPYFESHEEFCKRRFQSLHTVKPDQTGGLLGWLGNREDDVDRWEVDATPVKPQLDQIANERLRMPDLAQKLRNLWPSVK